MPTAKLTSKGQLTIPKAVRDSLRLQIGDRVNFNITNESEAVITPVTKSVDDVYGCLHQPGEKARTIDDMNAAVAARMHSGK